MPFRSSSTQERLLTTSPTTIPTPPSIPTHAPKPTLTPLQKTSAYTPPPPPPPSTSSRPIPPPTDLTKLPWSHHWLSNPFPSTPISPSAPSESRKSSLSHIQPQPAGSRRGSSVLVPIPLDDPTSLTSPPLPQSLTRKKSLLGTSIPSEKGEELPNDKAMDGTTTSFPLTSPTTARNPPPFSSTWYNPTYDYATPLSSPYSPREYLELKEGNEKSEAAKRRKRGIWEVVILFSTGVVLVALVVVCVAMGGMRMGGKGMGFNGGGEVLPGPMEVVGKEA